MSKCKMCGAGPDEFHDEFLHHMVQSGAFVDGKVYGMEERVFRNTIDTVIEPEPLFPDPENYEFDITTVHHDDLKDNGLAARAIRSRVVVSRKEFPTYGLAAETAACLAAAVHGGMPTQILPRY
jgi:hypothetical protein